MKLFNWIKSNYLFIITLFLLAFIPLYPKLPLIGVNHTWVYIRLDDFVVTAAIAFFVFSFLRRKISIISPLTIPIVIFWLVGAISTVYAVFFIFPFLANVFPTLAVLNYLRRIEYISLFFVAFASIKNKKIIPPLVVTLTITLLCVVGYGIGQRYLGYPAFLTMNEEFAKGIPLKLSAMSRIPSTFAGHYDLAAYLVMMIPILTSMIFGFRNIFGRVMLFISVVLGLVLLLMTASRVSFVVYLVTISLLLVLQKKKLFIIPVIVFSIILLQSFQGISNRFGSTISQADVVVDARTGKVIGIAQQSSTPNSSDKKTVVIKNKQMTGENLPQGSGFIDYPQETLPQKVTQVIYERSVIKAGTVSANIENLQGDYIIKKAFAYDVSFTTRFQGEWPRAIEAFKRNILLGSGYSSISLGTDGNYLRILGEVGILGLVSFFTIFLVAGIYTYKVLPDVDSSAARSFILGVIAAVFGISLNAILIDVFEASKIAYLLWILIGIAIGLLHLYQKREVNLVHELKKVVLSTPALCIYLFIATFCIFSLSISNYFVGDDFTWLRWSADCKKVLYNNAMMNCEPVKTTLSHYFTNADGFFYRPGTKLYFFVMYAIASLNPVPYHLFSICMHYVTVILVLLLSLKILKSKLFATITAFFFLVVSAHAESILWISAVGHIIASACILAALFFHLLWREKKQWIFFVLSLVGLIIAPLFHEVGIITPFLIMFYDLVTKENSLKKIITQWYYWVYFTLIPLYLFIRFIAQSHWFQGDYNYNVFHLPFNVLGNAAGYIFLTLGGNTVLSYYDYIRSVTRENLVITFIIVIGVVFGAGICYKLFWRKLSKEYKKMVLYAGVFFIIPLLPFLGLGNIATRYIYLASFGVILFCVFLLRTCATYLKKINTLMSVIVITSICCIFTYFQYGELKRTNADWYHAGELTRSLLINFNYTFTKPNTPLINPVFYFVNTPIRYQSAWVFPVGLKDAMWFTLKDANLTVHQVKTLKLALEQSEGSTSAKVFEFQKNGSVEEITKTEKKLPGAEKKN